MAHPPRLARRPGRLALVLVPWFVLAQPAAAQAPGCASYEACMDQAFTAQWNAYAGLIGNAAAGLRKDRALLARAQATGDAALIDAARQRVAAAERRWDYARSLAAAILDPDYEKHLQRQLARAQTHAERAAQRLARERDLLERYLRVYGPAREAVEREFRAEALEQRRIIKETALSAAGIALAGAEQVALPELDKLLDASGRTALKAGLEATAQVKDAAMRGWDAADAGIKAGDALDHNEPGFAALYGAGAASGLLLSSLKLAFPDPKGKPLPVAGPLFQRAVANAKLGATVATAGHVVIAGQVVLLSLDLARVYQSAWLLEDARGRHIDLELREQAMLHRVQRARVQQRSAERLQQAAQAQLDRRARIAALMEQAQDLQ